MPNLRGHHLICLHFFNGEGYNPEFIMNLQDVMKTAEYEDIRISPGSDDVCIKCPYLKEKRCYYNENSDEEIKRMDREALGLLNFNTGMNVGWNDIKDRLPELFNAWYKAYCTACGWKRACEGSASYLQLKNSIKDS